MRRTAREKKEDEANRRWLQLWFAAAERAMEGTVFDDKYEGVQRRLTPAQVEDKWQRVHDAATAFANRKVDE